jgi:hypothetical protein
MSQALLSEQELFQYAAEMDIFQAVDEVFGGRIRFGGNQLPELSKAQHIRLSMALQGTLTPA